MTGGLPASAGVADRASGRRLPALARLGRVRLQVRDLGRSEEFYTEALGLGVADRSEGRLVLSAGGAREPLVELIARPTVRHLTPRSRLGLFHYALLLPDRRSLADFALHADRRGLTLGMSDHLVSEALYLRDPDGLGIEVYADRPRTEWQSRDGQWVMATEPLDLEDLLAETDGATHEGLPTGTVIGHVHFHVGDLGEAARFYNDTLGFDDVVRDYPGALFFSAGGYHHHVGTNVWAPAAPSPGADDARLLSWMLVLPEEAHVTRLAHEVGARGYSIVEGGGSVRLADPWGTQVEIRSEASVATASAGIHPRVAAERREP
jgi:catechol 2,3-dioxygenase